MDHFLVLLKAAFSESANFLSWSFYAMITAYVSLAFLERNEFRIRYNILISKLFFFISMAIFIPNIYFVSQIFGEKLGSFAGIMSFIIGIFMMMLNSLPAITGIVQYKKQL